MSQSRLVEVRVLVRQSPDPSRCGQFVSSKANSSMWGSLTLALISRCGLPLYLQLPRNYAHKARIIVISPFYLDGHGRHGKQKAVTVQCKARRCLESPSRQLKNEGEINFRALRGQIGASRLYSLPSAVAVPLLNSSRQRW